MTRPSQLILESPHATSLNPLLYLGGTLENLIVTQHLTKTKVLGRQLEMSGLTASVWSILKQPLSLSSCVLSPGRGLQHGQNSAKKHKHVGAHLLYERRWHEHPHQHTDTLAAMKFVSFALSALLSCTQCLYTFNISPDSQMPASSVLSARPGKNKRGREQGLRSLN